MRAGRAGVAALLIAAVVAAAFLPVLSNDFVMYDDDVFITNNRTVLRGLTADGLRRAFAAVPHANWMPLTWISHMTDVTLFGLDARGHHLVNLLLHAANAALLFAVFRALTGSLLPSALAALLFGVHPLRVEAVAWAAERKEVLASLFWMLALLAYRRHAARPSSARMLAVSMLLALGLLAKPVLVTAPFVLLLLDWWPLGRLQVAKTPGRAFGALLAEKTPLFLLAAAGSVAAFLAQSRGGATVMLDVDPAVRAANGVVSYVRYLGTTIWPARLSFFYPHPERLWPAWAILGALLVLAALSWLALRERARRPWLLVGWLWYLGTLLPMIGVVQIGWQALADRYTYFTMTGLAAAVAWSVAEAGGRRPRLVPVLSAGAAVVLVALGVQTVRQSAVWRDSRTLFRHAIALDPDNWLGHQNLGAILVQEGDVDGALPHIDTALRLRPGHADAWYNLGCARLARREWPEAERALREAIRLKPTDADYFGNLGYVYFATGRMAESVGFLERALALNPEHESARATLATARRLLEAMRRRGAS